MVEGGLLRGGFVDDGRVVMEDPILNCRFYKGWTDNFSSGIYQGAVRCGHLLQRQIEWWIREIGRAHV